MNILTEPEIALTNLINAALESAKNRQVAKANKAFLAIYSLCREFPFILWDNKEILNLSKSYILMHHFETFDAEEENIEIAHWAYLYAYRCYEIATEQNDTQLIFDSLRDLVIILDNCNENFIDSVARYYLPKTGKITQDQIFESRQMATRILPLVTYGVILSIDEHFNSFKDDEMIENVCNEIETEYGTISDKLTKDAQQISRLLYKFTFNKVNSKDFSF